MNGDMYRSDVVDLSSIPEVQKSVKYLSEEIKKITGININQFPFDVDGGADGDYPAHDADNNPCDVIHNVSCVLCRECRRVLHVG